MKLTKLEQQTLALAALFQASQLVAELGTKGQCDAKAFETQINSIFTLDAPDFNAIYKNPHYLTLGLNCLTDILTKKSKNRVAAIISRYVLDIIFLQYRLMKKTDLLDFIRHRVQHATQQKKYFNGINDTVIDNLAEVFRHIVTETNKNIQIIGLKQYLKNLKLLNQMRSLLLSAIRASVLWQQLGGKRYHLFFAKSRILRQAQQLQADLVNFPQPTENEL